MKSGTVQAYAYGVYKQVAETTALQVNRNLKSRLYCTFEQEKNKYTLNP